VSGYHFTECPIKFHLWTEKERLNVHYFIVKKALEFSRSCPFLEFGDFYNAGFEGYLECIPKLKWTIEHSGVNYVHTGVLRGMFRQWVTWYGRADVPKGSAKRKAEYSQISLDYPFKKGERNAR